MTAGRKPKPTALKLIQGTYRPDRANPSEPKPKVMIPPCPSFLQGEARKQYKNTAKKLVRMRMITELDDMALAMLVLAWLEFVESTDQWKKSGMLVKSPNGFPMTNPYQVISGQAFKKVKSMLVEFGLTPGSRSGKQAAAGGDDTDDEWSRLLK